MKKEIEAAVVSDIVQNLKKLDVKKKTIHKITKKLNKEFKLNISTE